MATASEIEGLEMNAESTLSGFDYAHYEAVAPAVVQAMAALGRAVEGGGLERPLTELVKIRVSQRNHCVFCLQYHLNVARKIGVEGRKLDLLPTWREATIYTERERAALAWAEALTDMPQAHVTDAMRGDLMAVFPEAEVAVLTACVAAIQAWNRIAGGLHFPPPPAL